MITSHDAMKRLYNLRQGLEESNDDYFKRFEELWDTAAAVAGEESIVTAMKRTSSTYNNMSCDQLTEVVKAIFLFIKADEQKKLLITWFLVWINILSMLIRPMLF